MTTTEGSIRPQRQARRQLLSPTADPRRIVDAIREATKTGRAEKEILNFVRDSLRIARRQGRQEVLGRR